jgi:LuxR family transcriptional regulator, maltose regulon positive regulatory protein
MAERPHSPQIARLKIRPPAPPRDYVVRERLFQRLDEATTHRCTLVAAGPGYGKSLLLASWAIRQHRFERVAWLTLDTFDTDPQRLCSALLHALQEPFRFEKKAAEPLLGLRPLPAPPYLSFVNDALIPALENLGEPVLLVVDDVHHVATSPADLAILNTLLRWAPLNLHVVLAGRSDPPLALQRLRLAGQLSTLRQQELACTPQETADLLRAAGLEISAADSTALHDLAQGWPAALRLSALSLAEYGTVPAFLERFATRDVALADYLTSEVLNGLPDSLHDFVLRATVDDVVCGSLVDEVTGASGSASLLAECVHRNLFLTRVPGRQEEWYAWHHMFAGQMRRRFALADADGARQGHLAAAGWWRKRDPVLAVRHALEAEQRALGAEIVAASWLDLALRGESATLLELLGLLSEETDRSADLRLAACYAHLLEADLPLAAKELQPALTAADHLTGTARWRFDSLAAWLRLLLVDRFTALREAVGEAQRVVDSVPPEAAHPPSPAYALALLALGMGHARLQADPAAAIRLLRDAADAGRAAGLDVLEFVARAELCIPLMAEGDPRQIEQESTQIVEEARRRGWEDFSPVSAPLGVLAWLTYWKGDIETARRELEQVRDISPRADWSLRGLAAYFHGRASLVVGDVDAAESDLAEARELADAGCLPPHAESLIAGLTAEILAVTAGVPAALAALPEPGEAEYRMTAFTRADLLRRSGLARESVAVLDAMPQQKPYPHTPVVDGVLRALALDDLGQEDAAHDSLERALAAAEPARLLQPFLANADAMRPLIEAHVKRGTVHEAFAMLVAERLAAPVVQPSGGRHSTLTQRELSILRYLRTSMPNAEIAAELFVSVNTVKTHTASIYRKLGVSGRREAIRKAEGLGLFASAGMRDQVLVASERGPHASNVIPRG